MKTFKKRSIHLVFSISLTLIICSCSKNSNQPNSQQSKNNILRIQVSSPFLTTVLLLQYNASNNITSITDSVNGIHYDATYDGSGNLVHIVELSGSTPVDSISYTYENGLMTSFQLTYQGTFSRGKIFYTNGVLSSDSAFDYYMNSPLDSSFSTFQLMNGNITSLNFFDPPTNNSFTYTYNSQPNLFKQLSLFNWTNGLGDIDIAGFNAFFNKNLMEGYSAPEQSTVETATYAYDSTSRLVEAKSVEIIGGTSNQTYDWLLSY